MEDFAARFTSLLGLVAIIALAWAMSSNRGRFPWRVVVLGVLLQFALAACVLATPWGKSFFDSANNAVQGFQSFVEEGSSFVFGLWPNSADQVGGDNKFLLNSFVFGVLPTVIVFSSLMAVLYHIGLMQLVVKSIAWVMQRTLGTSGPETLAAAANIFVGHTEAPLVVRSYLERLSRSELNALMVGGFATVTGGLLVTYASVGAEAGHLVTASVISGPAALLIAKVMEPEEQGREVETTLELSNDQSTPNIIGAASQGASDGLKLALNIAAMLIAFLALLALADYCVGQLGIMLGFQTEEGEPVLSFTMFLAYIFQPIAWLIGVPWEEAFSAGKLLGIKVFANEVVAYEQMGQMINSNLLSERSIHIMTYALCGFSNFSAIGIQVGGIGGLAPGRKHEIAKLGLRAMIGGTFACLMTAAVAGIFL